MIEGFRPAGEADRRLLETVRPGGWTNPAPAGRYDLLVVGAGTGGLVSAAIGAALGARVALVERALMGGDCLNHGCVPSKALLRAARSWAEARASADRFGGPTVTAGGDFPRVMERMREIRAEMSEADGAERFRSLGVDVFFGEARFDGRDSVAVGEARLSFRRAILATGARPAVPAIPGLSGIPFLTNETLFDLPALPGRLLVLGAGPMGCEMAQAFARFGSRVTLLERGKRPLPGEEPEASEILQAALERDGVTFLGGAEVTEARREGKEGVALRFRRGGETATVTGDALLVAVGRIPNVDAGLEAAGVAFGPEGIRVDDRLRTTNRRIYAVGDVASPRRFTHVADAQARLAVRNALFFGRGRMSALAVPSAVFTSPEVARVGPTLADLAGSGIRVETVRIPFREVDRARLDGAEEGVLLLHLRRGRGEILGATVVAPQGGELVSQVTQAVHAGVRLEALGEALFPYPTASEAFKKAADRHRRRRLTPAAQRLFRLFFRARRLLPL